MVHRLVFQWSWHFTLRALEPLEGLEQMKEFRSVKRKDGGARLKDKDICSGPSKLCEALRISKEEINEEDMKESNLIWLQGRYQTHQGPRFGSTTSSSCRRGGGSYWESCYNHEDRNRRGGTGVRGQTLQVGTGAQPGSLTRERWKYSSVFKKCSITR